MKQVPKYLIPVGVTFAIFTLFWFMVTSHLDLWGSFRWWTWVKEIFTYEVKPWLIIILLTTMSLMIGRLVVRSAPISLSILIGLGITASLIWLLCLMSLLHLLPWIAGICFVATCIVLGASRTKITSIFAEGFRTFKGFTLLQKMLLGFIAYWVLRTLPLACNPSVGFDAIYAHLWQNNGFLAADGYVYNEWYTNIALVHMPTLFVQKLGVNDPGATIQYLGMLLGCVFIYQIADRWFNRTTGLVAIILWLLTPMNYMMYQNWWSGQYVVLFMLAGIYCMFDKKPWLTGILLGFGCAAKITMLPIAFFIIVFSYKDWWKVLLGCVAAASPWYLVNCVQYGNPIFPFYDSYFQWVPWGTKDAMVVGLGRPPLPDTWFTWDYNPWTATMQGNNPVSYPGVPSLMGPFMLALTPLLVFAPWTLRLNFKSKIISMYGNRWRILRWKKGKFVIFGHTHALQLLCLTALLWLYWLFGERVLHARYMMPLWTLHTFLCAWALVHVMRWNDG